MFKDISFFKGRDVLFLMRVECPKGAYDRLFKTRIDTVILDERDKLFSLLLMTDSEPLGDILNEAEERFDGSEGKKQRLYWDLLKFKCEWDNQDVWLSHRIRDLLSEHPSVLGYLVLKGSVFDFNRYGFPSRRSLEEAVTSYCLGEELSTFDPREWIWRTGYFKNVISQNIHGDLYVGQTDVSGERDDLFENEKFILKDPKSNGFSAYQDWSQFLISILKYAREIGEGEVKDITDWKKVLDSIGGGVGTHTAECEFGGGGDNWGLRFSYENNILNDQSEITTVPLVIYASGEHVYYPYVCNGNLVYLRESEKGDITFNSKAMEWKYKKVVEFCPEDLPDLLKGTYKYFARDRSDMYKIMDMFLEDSVSRAQR